MSTLTPNYGLHLPENTDSMDDFFTNYESDMTTIDDHLGSGGGATIEEMTQAEYEALPDTKLTDGILRGLKDVKSFLDADILYLGTCYSTSERMVGCWIDGKPLYTKTVDFGSLPNNTTKTVSHGVANVDKIWVAGGFAFQPNGDFVNQLSLYVPNSNAGWYIGVNSTNIECYTVIDRSNYSAFVVLYYTKTTDAVGSGTWTPSGVNAVHYDDTEKVIGTWFGETLYEKTIHIVEQSEQTNKNYTSEIASLNASHIKLKNAEVKLGSNGGNAWYTAPFWYDGSYNMCVAVSPNDMNIFSRGWKYTEAYVTLQYTKSS